ncbi:hypothetical protein ACRASX_06865 [Flavobacterium sp. TMP13]|uniref:hypothetical protein n=1 Tax=Flavobacterium sp. TMP13 TaxID=3425950 RepID=UPI003D777E7C
MRIILFFFIFSFLQIQSQTTIKGTIKDSLQNPVSLVNVRLYNKLDNVLIDFKQSNNLGQFELVCPDAETKIFLLKASFLGYKPVVFEFSTDGNRSIIEKNIILKNEVVAMKEVVIKADFRDVNEKNDTITFNLKRLLNGSEQKLKDVIKKLPGLSIDKNGKIRYQGKKIDDVLIDGHEFFGTQHQLATENLKSEMIEKIEILKNFKNLSSITGFDNNKRTALNLSLKNQYKNTIKGDVSQEYGYKKSYRQHNTIYNFGGKIKVNVITDVNNTNNPAFTVTDYLELKKGIQNELFSENSSSSITVDEDVPSFLFATDNVNAKDIQFYSVNFSDKISKTSKVKYSSMLNYIKQSEFLQAKQNFFSTTDIIIDKNSSIAGKSLFSTNKISYEYKPNENNYFNYVLAVNYSANKRINLVRTILATNQANFDDSKNNVDTGVGQFFSHKIKLNDKFLFEYNLFADFTSFTKHLNITANQPFFNLKFNEDFLINQRTDGYNNSLGVNSKLRIKNEFGTLILNAGSSLKNDSFNNFIDDLNPQFSTELNLVRTNNYLGVNFSKKKIYKFNYALGARLEYVQFEHNSKRADNLVFLPSANFSYEVSNEININLNYKRDFSNVTIDKVITGMLIEDYRTVFRSKNVFYNSILPKNTITLNGSYSSSRTGIRSFFGLYG